MEPKSLKIYCINLKERTDRWERFINQPGVKRLNEKYEFERIEGVNGKLLDIKNDDRVSLRTKRNILYQKRRDHEDLDTAGGVGCYLSHHSAWKKLLDSNKEKVLIFEDDAEVPMDFIERLEVAMDDLEQEDVKRPDIWLLSKPFGATMQKALDLNEIQYTNNWTHDVTGPLTGYIIYRNGAKVLCENAFPIDGHVDHFMHRCSQMGLLTLSHNKNISLKQIRLNNKDSDIQQKSTCDVCDLPDALKKKGYLIITNQNVAAIFVGSMAIISLFCLKAYTGK